MYIDVIVHLKFKDNGDDTIDVPFAQQMLRITKCDHIAIFELTST